MRFNRGLVIAIWKKKKNEKTIPSSKIPSSCMFSFLLFEVLASIVIVVFHLRSLGVDVVRLWGLWSVPSSVLCRRFPHYKCFIIVMIIRIHSFMYVFKRECCDVLVMYRLWQSPVRCWLCFVQNFDPAFDIWFSDFVFWRMSDIFCMCDSSWGDPMWFMGR